MQCREHLMQFNLPEPFGKVAMHVLDWGDENSRHNTICVHGLTRQAHDFDWLARHLAENGRRVFSLDMPGRGESPWLENKMLYGYPLYVALVMAFMDNFHMRGVEWIGTSMGGLIGMMIAATQPKRISKLVMNDIGARISDEGLKRIMQYVSTLPSRFESEEAAQAYLQKAFEPFGIRDEAVLKQFMGASIKPLPEGGVMLKTDPDIAAPLLAQAEGGDTGGVDLSSLWIEVRCPTLIIRGEESDLLSKETVSAMLSSNLRAEATTIAGAGHAPSLTTPEQIGIILRFLTKGSMIPSQAIGA